MTEQIEAIAKRLVVNRKRDGRCVYDAKAKGELVAIARQPGLSLARIARVCGINANVLSNWMRLHERGKSGGAAPRGEVIEMPASAFVAVQVESSDGARAETRALDVQVRLPNGVTVALSGCDADDAARLIDALGRVRCSASTKG
jgi:transposase